MDVQGIEESWEQEEGIGRNGKEIQTWWAEKRRTGKEGHQVGCGAFMAGIRQNTKNGGGGAAKEEVRRGRGKDEFPTHHPSIRPSPFPKGATTKHSSANGDGAIKSVALGFWPDGLGQREEGGKENVGECLGDILPLADGWHSPGDWGPFSAWPLDFLTKTNVLPAHSSPFPALLLLRDNLVGGPRRWGQNVGEGAATDFWRIFWQEKWRKEVTGPPPACPRWPTGQQSSQLLPTGDFAPTDWAARSYQWGWGDSPGQD